MNIIKLTDEEIHILFDVLVGGGACNKKERAALKSAFNKIEEADDKMHNRNMTAKEKRELWTMNNSQPLNIKRKKS